MGNIVISTRITERFEFTNLHNSLDGALRDACATFLPDPVETYANETAESLVDEMVKEGWLAPTPGETDYATAEEREAMTDTIDHDVVVRAMQAVLDEMRANA